MNYAKGKKEFEKKFTRKVTIGKFDPSMRCLVTFGIYVSPKDIWNWITQVFAKRVERKLIKKMEGFVKKEEKRHLKQREKFMGKDNYPAGVVVGRLAELVNVRLFLSALDDELKKDI